MNAAPETQLRLLELQALDSALQRLDHRRRTLPEHAEIDRVGSRLTELRNEVVRAQTSVDDLSREQRRIEMDVDVVRTRMARDQTRLDTGQVGSPRELENLQHEIGSLSRRQGALEDQVLEVMERTEEAETRLAVVSSERSALETELETLTARRDDALAVIDAERSGTGVRRAEVATEIPVDLTTLYERIRSASDGVGAAALARGRCEGCRLSLTPVELSALRSAAADEVLRCEECRRILVRTPESGL